jgi:hypothetical protein
LDGAARWRLWQAAEKLSHRHQDTMTQSHTTLAINAFTDLLRLRVFCVLVAISHFSAARSFFTLPAA